MIQLPISEAEAFDYLSIIQVKLDRGMDVAQRYSEVGCAIESSGILIEHVLLSIEYKALYTANAYCFDAIERAHDDQISASEVQRINHRRFLAKRSLQAKFWPDKPLSERKTLDEQKV